MPGVIALANTARRRTTSDLVAVAENLPSRSRLAQQP